MSSEEIVVAGAPVTVGEGWTFEWVDPRWGVVRASRGNHALTLLAEGSGQDWAVTIRGRRVEIQVRTWRERLLAEAETAADTQDGPTTVRASLPGLVVAVAVSVGDEVEAGVALLTIEAMKMQNEVRAPRAGRVIEVSVTSGQAVAAGIALLRLA